jgi:hypothetical protein
MLYNELVAGTDASCGSRVFIDHIVGSQPDVSLGR